MGYRVIAPLVVARDQAGMLHHTYEGSYIDWLSDEQAEHFLSLDLVEPAAAPVEDEPSVPDLDEDQVERPKRVALHRVSECAAALDGLCVPTSVGAPTARAALREGGYKFGNEIIASAVRWRIRSDERSVAQEVSGTHG